MCRRRSSVGVATDDANILIRRIDELRAHPRMASTYRRAYAVHQKFRIEQQSVWILESGHLFSARFWSWSGEADFSTTINSKKKATVWIKLWMPQGSQGSSNLPDLGCWLQHQARSPPRQWLDKPQWEGIIRPLNHWDNAAPTPVLQATDSIL